MIQTHEILLTRAEESLAGAMSEFTNGRFNNCANRCYYSCFQGAIAALLKSEVLANNPQSQWGHAFVQSQFVGQLIHQRKAYPAHLRDTLARLLILRQTADYEIDSVSEKQASRALRRAQEFMTAIQEKYGEIQ